MNHSNTLTPATGFGTLLKKTIQVLCPPDGGRASAEIAISYQIDFEEDIVLISCMMEIGPATLLPSWLRIRKFQARARLNRGYYTMLYSQGCDDFGVDTSLFIERAASQIMSREH